MGIKASEAKSSLFFELLGGVGLRANLRIESTMDGNVINPKKIHTQISETIWFREDASTGVTDSPKRIKAPKTTAPASPLTKPARLITN
jgi:hypothetical protein